MVICSKIYSIKDRYAGCYVEHNLGFKIDLVDGFWVSSFLPLDKWPRSARSGSGEVAFVFDEALEVPLRLGVDCTNEFWFWVRAHKQEVFWGFGASKGESQQDLREKLPDAQARKRLLYLADWLP